MTKQLAEAEDALEALKAERGEAVANFLLSKHDEAQQSYFEAVAALRGPIEQMVAVERAWQLALADRKFPERGANVLTDVREKGIRVTWEHSALQDPAVAAGYTDNFREAWYVPEWADARNESIADESTAALVGDLKSIGFDVTMPVREVPKTEPQVEIEIVWGTIEGGYESTKMDPVSGQLVKGKEVSYGPGSRLTVPQSYADSCVRSGAAKYTRAADIERAHQQAEQEKAERAAMQVAHKPAWSPIGGPYVRISRSA